MRLWFWRGEDRAVVTEGASRDEFSAPTRIQTNILARGERKLLTWLCGLTPKAVTPDHYTAIGFLGAVVAAAGYALSNWRLGFLLLAAFGIFLNWVGDSLDGSLARYRKIERPQYGYYLDHSFDVINISFIFIGLGLSPYVRADVALFALIGCLLITIQVLLANHVEGRFHIGFVGLGPTELRLVLIGFCFDMYFIGPKYWAPFGLKLTNDTIFTGVLGLIFVGMFVNDFVRLERRLAKRDPRPEPP